MTKENSNHVRRQRAETAAMPKRTVFKSLHVKLMLVMLLGFVCAFGLYFLTNAVGDMLINRYYMSEQAVRARNVQTIDAFQSYVLENKLSSRDTDEIARWTVDKQDVYILLYQNQRLALEAGWWGVDDSEMMGEQELENLMGVSVYPVSLRDGVFQAVVYDFSETHLYNLRNIVAIILSCSFFALTMLFYSRRITRAIITISHEVHQIGEGNLQLQLKAEGNDELAMLSRSVEMMRLSILKKTEQERQALQQNSDLITAMSHDIRNPLTALMGYLDLARSRQYRSQEELESYIDVSYDKAIQLKKLTDELFRYSLLFGSRELPLDLQEYDAQILLGQVLGEHSAALEQQGFSVRLLLPPIRCKIRVDVTYLSRVLDNLFDNIRKYACPEEPVLIAVLQENKQLHICLSNVIRQDPGKVESNKIGLRTCEKIMLQMNGRFLKRSEDNHFTVEMILPAVEAQAEEMSS